MPGHDDWADVGASRFSQQMKAQMPQIDSGEMAGSWFHGKCIIALHVK
jgi:hypothetical protein